MTTLSKLHQAFSDLVSWCRSGKDEDEASSDMMFESEDERRNLSHFFAGQWGPAVQQIMLVKFCCSKFFGIPIWFIPGVCRTALIHGMRAYPPKPPPPEIAQIIRPE